VLLPRHENRSGFTLKAEIKCQLCKISLATLEDPEAKETARIFKKHLATHKLAEIYDFALRNASLFYPETDWRYENQHT
jgi:hypothetical protein